METCLDRTIIVFGAESGAFTTLLFLCAIFHLSDSDRHIPMNI